jgi:acylglycerol lipase
MKKFLLAVVGAVAVAVLGLGFGVGCAAPAYVAGRRVAPPVPPEVEHAEGRLDAKDGVSLLVQSWRPKQGEVKAVVVVVHGLKDYSDRYAGFAHALTQHGYAVHALDLRGHGDSGGDRVWVERFSDYLDDLQRFVEKVQAEEPGKPLFLFGHSMGGAVVTLFTLTRHPKAAGLVLSGAALKADAPALLRGSVHFFSVVAPKLAVFELKDEQFCRDEKVVADKTAKKYPGLYHDLLHEPEAAQVTQDVLAWLDAHTPGGAQ